MLTQGLNFNSSAPYLTKTFRYLQAKFIEMRSRQAKERVEKECRNQLFHAFSATESLRQELMRKQEEEQMWSNIAMMKKSLEVVEMKLSPALNVGTLIIVRKLSSHECRYSSQ